MSPPSLQCKKKKNHLEANVNKFCYVINFVFLFWRTLFVFLNATCFYHKRSKGSYFFPFQFMGRENYKQNRKKNTKVLKIFFFFEGEEFLKYYKRRNSKIKFSNRVAIRTFVCILKCDLFLSQNNKRVIFSFKKKKTEGSYIFPFQFMGENLKQKRKKCKRFLKYYGPRNSEIKFRLLFTFANFNCTLSILPTACFIYYLKN